MAPTPTVALHCLGFPTERLQQLSRASGLPVWHSEGDWNDSTTRVVLLLGHAWEDQAASYFALPYSAWIEVAALADQPILELVERAVAASFYASFTTITANRLNLAGQILVAIAAQRPLSEVCRDNIELALHEALCNALLHGNLQMDGIGDLSVDALERFSRNLMHRIADHDLANRRIDIICEIDTVSVTIDVSDQGGGYIPKPITEPKASGRGFELIAASCLSYQVLDGGRRVSMRFLV